VTSVRILPHRRLGTILLVALVGACTGPEGNPKVPAGARSSGGLHAVIETDRGAIEIEFFAREAPRAVENFRLLAEHGYYDGLTFHRIVRGFMIQGGDPAGRARGATASPAGPSRRPSFARLRSGPDARRPSARPAP